MGDLVHIVEIGYLSIPSYLVLSHLLWMAAPSSMPLSLSLVAVDVRLVPGPLLRSPPGPPPTAGRSASAPPPFPLRCRISGPPSVTPPSFLFPFFWHLIIKRFSFLWKNLARGNTHPHLSLKS